MRFPGNAKSIIDPAFFLTNPVGALTGFDPAGDFLKGSTVGQKVFGSDDGGTSPPPIPEPAVAPIPDDKARRAAQRRRAAGPRQRSGRLSTFNTGPQATVLG